jgi:hypothetical protein
VFRLNFEIYACITSISREFSSFLNAFRVVQSYFIICACKITFFFFRFISVAQFYQCWSYIHSPILFQKIKIRKISIFTLFVNYKTCLKKKEQIQQIKKKNYIQKKSILKKLTNNKLAERNKKKSNEKIKF